MDSRRDHRLLFWFPMVWIPPRNCTLYTAEDQCVHSVRSGAAWRRNEPSSAWGYLSCRRMSEVAGARGQDLRRSAETQVFVGRAPRISMAQGLQHLATQGVGAQEEARCPLGAATSAVVLGLAAIGHPSSDARLQAQLGGSACGCSTGIQTQARFGDDAGSRDVGLGVVGGSIRPASRVLT